MELLSESTKTVQLLTSYVANLTAKSLANVFAGSAITIAKAVLSGTYIVP